jgi:hypothetical protein
MARTDIARVIARAVLEDLISGLDGGDVADVLLRDALSVKRRRMNNVGEVVELVYVVPPDPTTPED